MLAERGGVCSCHTAKLVIYDNVGHTPMEAIPNPSAEYVSKFLLKIYGAH